jgi:hypothetical protein
MVKLASVIINFNYAVFKALLLLLLLSNPMPTSQPFNREIFNREIVVADKPFDRDKKLQAEADALLFLFDKMPPVPVYLKDEPILKSGTNTEKGAAYTQCSTQAAPTIYVKKIFYQKTNRKQLVNLLKHELTHAWLCRQRVMSVGHDAAFREKFTQVGGFGN